MTPLNSTREFRRYQAGFAAARGRNKRMLVIPAGTCGRASGATELVEAIEDALRQTGLETSLNLRVTGCHGFCEVEPSIVVAPEGVFYPRVAVKDAERIVTAAACGDVVDDLVWQDSAGLPVPLQKDVPFFKKQVRTLLSRNERVDPRSVATYLENGGYSALLRVLEQGDPRWVIGEVKSSGLRGRGGAGFPTGIKWELLAKQPCALNGNGGKILVCNADEGDPGAYMDRSLLEGNPHSILEGMLIGAYATGAAEGILYVRNEYPLAIKHLNIAIGQARELGLLGHNILGAGFSFDVQVVEGAGAFVCGEETALISSIEGRMGQPRQRPPFPIQKGIGGRPTGINNVETWANIPPLIEMGAEAFAKTGAKNNSGTKIFSLVGKIKNTGLVEVPMGISIREIVEEIGGGPSTDAPVKAVQTGGPSGGCIPVSRFDLPIDYDSLSRAQSIMGSGGMIVMDERTCIVDVAKYFMAFLKDESCGTCFSCRKGTQRMHEILEDVSEGRAAPEQLELLEELALVVRDTTLCGLGQTASNPVLSTLRYFRDEYVEHIEHKRCRAGVCKALISYSITEICTGCLACVKRCPTGAISGERKQRQVIDLEKCIKCGTCRDVCKQNAVEVA